MMVDLLSHFGVSITHPVAMAFLLILALLIHSELAAAEGLELNAVPGLATFEDTHSLTLSAPDCFALAGGAGGDIVVDSFLLGEHRVASLGDALVVAAKFPGRRQHCCMVGSVVRGVAVCVECCVIQSLTRCIVGCVVCGAPHRVQFRN